MKTSLATIISVLTLSLGASQHAAAADTYNIDPVHSRVSFRVQHFGASYFHAQFFDTSGSFSVDPKNIGKSAVEVTTKIASLDTHDDKRNGHLQSPDFFNAKAFPVMTFKGKRFKKLGSNKVQVTGDLMLHGVTKSVTLTLEHVGEGKDPWGGYRSGYEGSFTLKRSDYGMKFMLGGIGDEVNVTLSIEGVRK